MGLPDVGQRLTVGQLGRVHHGWLIGIPNPHHDASQAGTGPASLTVTFGGIRELPDRDGVEWRGVLALDFDGPFRGSEYALAAGVEVLLERNPHRGMPRPRAADYRTCGDSVTAGV